MPSRNSKPKKTPSSKKAAAKQAAEKPAAAKALPTIDALRIKGYKSIVDSGVLELGDITLICGPNSAGKSALMQPLLMMKQTVERFSDPGGLWIGGPNVVFGNANEFLSRVESPRAHSMSTAVRVSNGDWFEIEFARRDSGAFRAIRSVVSPAGNNAMELRDDLSTEECALLLNKLGKLGYPARIPEQGWKSLKVKSEGFWQVLADAESGLAALDPFGVLRRSVADLIHVSGLRDQPRRAYDLMHSGLHFRGLFHEYTASVLDSWNEERRAALKLLTDALSRMGIAYDVKTERLSDTSVSVLVRPLKNAKATTGWVNVCDVGLGVSQVLPVLVATMFARPSQRICYIEQPEIHLHPNAQYELGRYLGTLASFSATKKLGPKLIIETHSSLLLLGLQEAHVEAPEARVVLHWASLGADGRTTFTSATMDEQGRYGDWPVDFDAVSVRAMQSFWEQLERKAAEK